jgi:hypothetical protein
MQKFSNVGLGKIAIRLLPVLFFLLCGVPAFCQGFGSIVGTVTDASGAVVAGAKVTVSDASAGFNREQITNGQGYFVFPSLRPAKYDVIVSATGFSQFAQNGVVLLADQSATVNASLAVGKATETVSVTADAPQVNTTTSTMSEVVEQRRVVDLPLNGRNAASLLLVVAGAIPAPANDVDQGNTKTFPTVVTVSTNGARQNQVSFRLDGANNNDIYTNSNQPFPFPDALQEFSVQTSNYNAEYGGNAGGVVNIVTKSGTNAPHGDLFEFVRNADFNARNFFAPKRDPLKRNQYGGVIGGPVMIPKLYNGKDKTFFFFGYQGTKIRTIGNTASAFLPTVAERSGDFSALLDAANPANPFHKAIQITDRNGVKIRGNVLQPGQLDAAAVKFLTYLPISPAANGQLFYSQPVSQNFGEYTARGDHNISEHDRVSMRYFYDKFSNAGFLDPTNYLSFQNYSDILAQNALAGETHVFGPTAVNEFRLSFSRETSVRGPAVGSIGLSDLGVSIYQPPTAKTIEGLNVSGYFNPAQTDPAQFIRNQYNLSDDFSLVRGRHSLSFGGTVIRAQVLLRNQFRTSGSYSFTSDVTGDALASFMQGYVRTFTQGFGEFKDNMLNTYSVYAADDFHASRRLTINLGLRYDPLYPWNETKGRMELFSVSAYNAGVHSQVYTNAPAGLLFPGDPGIPHAGAHPSLNNVAPRIGFAYDVDGTGKTSIRGGAGLFYDALMPGVWNNRFVDVTPYSPQFSLTTPAGTLSNPYVGFTNPYPSPFPPLKNTAFPGPVLVISYDPANGNKQQTPAVYNWNLSVEHQLTSSWLLHTAYVGSRSTHLMESLELNPAIFTVGSKLSTDARRAFQPYGSITQDAQDVNSTFHSAQVTLQKRMSHGFTILANYTWSKSLDDAPAGQGISGIGQGGNSPVPWNFAGRHAADYGPSEFDHTHRFVLSYVWDLPRFNNRNALLRYTVGGWQWSGIITAQTGQAFTVLAGKDQSQTGLGTDRVSLTGVNPYGGSACGSSAPCVNYLNTLAFTVPTTGTFGNEGKGVLRGPHLITWDTGVFKEFPFAAERVRLQFRAEFFNVFNHTNFNNPFNSGVPSYSSSGFGTITSAQDPRIGQLALKLLF